MEEKNNKIFIRDRSADEIRSKKIELSQKLKKFLLKEVEKIFMVN